MAATIDITVQQFNIHWQLLSNQQQFRCCLLWPPVSTRTHSFTAPSICFGLYWISFSCQHRFHALACLQCRSLSGAVFAVVADIIFVSTFSISSAYTYLYFLSTSKYFPFSAVVVSIRVCQHLFGLLCLLLFLCLAAWPWLPVSTSTQVTTTRKRLHHHRYYYCHSCRCHRQRNRYCHHHVYYYCNHIVIVVVIV